jgi:predicted nucleic acid-binding Zn ribbon protein
VKWLAKLNFEVIDTFFRHYLLGTTGIKSRDQKRREENQKRGSQPFDSGRDPVKASASLEQLFGEFNWTSQLAQATLFTEWHKVVGEDSAEASYPEELKNEVLSVRCRSTAWATQLRLLAPQILEKINQQHPDVLVSEIRLVGPTAPSWKKGSRSVPGRGPRDTYG